MKYKKCHLIVIFSIIFIIALTSTFIDSNEKISPKPANLTFDPPIIIDSDSDFISIGVDGSGNATSPYIISDFVIDVSGFLNDGILVEGTTKHFIIENCTVYTDYIGIRIMNVASGTAIVRNNTCISKSYDGGGLGVWGNNVQFINNTCSNFAQGFHANQASNIYIINNTIRNSTYQGINIRYTSNSVIGGNLITDCAEYAISIVKSTSTGNLVYSNRLIGNAYSDNANIDGTDMGKPDSQGYDEGSENTWYNQTSQIGNYWSDCRGVNYKIDGPADSIDEFPLNCNSNIPGFYGIGVISLLVIILSVIAITFRQNKGKFQP